MSMTDPIADLPDALFAMRNPRASPPWAWAPSKLKVAILKVLKAEGYIAASASTQAARRARCPSN